MVFAKLTRKYAEVSNYPGTTVDISRGAWQGLQVSDTPGVYGLNGANDEERLAEELIAKAGVIINVVDATRLRRDLFLTLQLMGRGAPMLVVVNMMDEARRLRACPDLPKLQAELRIPVIGAAAVLGEGMSELVARLKSIVCEPALPQRRLAAESPEKLRARANKIFRSVLACGEGRTDLSAIDRWLTRPSTGVLTGVAILATIWWVIGGLVAGNVVNFTEGIIMNRWLLPPLVRFVHLLISRENLLAHVITGDFGILTMALGYGIGLLLPLVFSFYLLLAVLEDSGYMPRLAVLLDNVFRPLGLNGKAVIPLILGFGCVTMAMISTRILPTRRERIILTFLLGLAVPCSSQTGIIAMMLVPMGLGWLALYALILVTVFIGIGYGLNKVVPGKSTGLFLELPSMRLPRPGNVLRKTWSKSWAFLKDALPLFALGSVLITLLNYFHVLAALEELLAPLTAGWLKLPPQVLGAFIMGMIRRDFGAAGLHSLALAGPERFIALLTMTLFVPCIASVLVAIKEQGLLVGLGVWLSSMVLAVLTGGIAAMLLSLWI